MKIIIPLAGFGTRMRPHTWSRPKPLLHVAGNTVIGHLLNLMSDITSEEVIFVVGYKGDEIEAWIRRNYPHLDAHFVVQEQALGQAHAIWLCRDFLDEGEVLVAFGDGIVQAEYTQVAEKTADGVWQLTPHSVQRVGDSRAGVEQLLNELNRLNRGPLPAPLVNQLKIWGQYHGTATAQTLTLIEFREPSVLQEIMADSALRPYFTPFPAGDRTLAAVAAGDLPQIEKLLIQMGIPLIHI